MQSLPPQLLEQPSVGASYSLILRATGNESAAQRYYKAAVASDQLLDKERQFLVDIFGQS
jgi:hypothetical protein